MSERRQVWASMGRGERIFFALALPFLLVVYAASWLHDWYEHG
ncbi:hypothetical protein [Agromyces humi]|nr:hypothetical protein [Agromyces humi]